ncbi:hypothetical protein ACTXJ1_10100 [Brachybacterium alimentarium]|uniref:hypothetical protein n=1 Tax=Brachybacterium alimentarium TaxID=47845 RepID=UPI003FD31801
MNDLDIIDAEIVEDLTYAEARDITDEIKGDLDAIWEKVKIAWHGKAWKALGHKTWDDYCATEFRGAGLALPREDRPEVVRSLAQSGLSIKGIASATGADRNTVRKDLRQGGEIHPPAEPREQMGADGKTYPIPAKPEPPHRVNTDTGEVIDKTTGEVITHLPDHDAIARETNAIENVAHMTDTLRRLSALRTPEYRARLIENSTAHPDHEDPAYTQHFNPQGVRDLAALLATFANELENAS